MSLPAANLRWSASAGGLSRRELLRIGGLGIAGMSLPRLLAAAEAPPLAGGAARADACICIYLNGGPSHLDMWDMKPDAPVEIRGEFTAIPSSLPGVPFSEHLPKLAQWTHQATLVRSMHHNVNNSHANAVYTALTGHDRGDANIIVGTGADDHPNPGAVLTHLRPPTRNVVPYVALPYKTKEGAGGPPQPGFTGGFIGQGYDPLWVVSDPNAPDFAMESLSLVSGMDAARFADRRSLLRTVDRRRREDYAQPALGAMDRFQTRALELLTSSAAQQAFQLHREPDAIRESYGRNIYGQSVLLARRLVEAGTRFVNISWAPDANATWDTHNSNFKRLKNELLPQFDAACSSLLADLAERGLLARTLVAVLGDFGRSPRINNADGGRDHWNNCYTVMLAGGGVKPGFVFGASDRIGARPADAPVTPGDLIATIYQLFGLDPRTEVHDRLQRPFPIVQHGRAIRELIA